MSQDDPSPGEGSATELTGEEKERVSSKQPARAAVLHEIIRVQGESELSRRAAALAWSALAAGLSMGFSTMFRGLFHVRVPEGGAQRLFESLGYSIGFLIVILARQQLFTENTITAVLPVITRPSPSNALRLLRLWGIVLVGNLAGVLIFSYGLARLELFSPDVTDAFAAMGRELVSATAAQLFSRAIIAGWLIATMVWLLPAASGAKFWTILLITSLIGLAGFPHIIVGATEASYLAFLEQISWHEFLFHFFLPVLAGNVAGGTFVFALLSHAQVVSEG